MRVLLIGKGGREHALAWKIAKSPLLTRLYVWPGNPAMAGLATALEVSADAHHDDLVAVAQSLAIDLVVCGPEAPLSEGLADRFQAGGIPTFGPSAAAARLEASKEFAKGVMAKAGIPTASHQMASGEAECRSLARAALAERGGVVLKASGLAAGKGVFVCKTQDEVEAGLKHLYHTDMRAAAATVIVEELLEGRECSYFTAIGKGGATGLGFAVDFKRLEDGDQGPNTGGMGCYAPVPWLPPDAERRIEAEVVHPLLRTLSGAGIAYRGWLYVGIMWSQVEGPLVIEFNVRLGDPEAEVLALYDDRDWLAVIAAKCGLSVPVQTLSAATAPLTHKDRAVVVVMAAKSYPFGDGGAGEIAELPLSAFAGPVPLDREPPRLAVFAASVKPGATGVVTGTGRVLVVGGRGRTFEAARELAYGKVWEIAERWRGARWRKDIGERIAREVDP